MVFALAGDSTTTTFMRTFKKGSAKERVSGAKPDFRDDARCGRRVPVPGAGWRRQRETMGLAPPVRQPPPVWLRVFRPADRALHPPKPAAARLPARPGAALPSGAADEVA